MSIIITLIIFTVIVVIHEFGHFIVAKKCNVRVDEFAVGMGPKLYGKKVGETEYTIRILPLGGFCRMADEIKGNNEKIGFNDASVLQRIAICFAGPFMNFVLAIAIMIFLSISLGFATNNISDIIENSSAYNAGLESGDKVISFDGHRIHTNMELEFYKSECGENPIDVVVERNGEKLTKTLIPQYNEETGRYLLGVRVNYTAPFINVLGRDMQGAKKANITSYISDGYWSSVALVKLTFLGFSRLVTQKIDVNDLSGPIGVTAEVNNQYQQSSKSGFIAVFLTMINLVALLSVNLGVINLLPIPAIDGGKLLIYLVELITKYRLPKEKEAYISLIGFVLVMGLGVFIAFNDIMKLL
ncbi:MAG: M50 family metallopeptidase [Lachnospirales bacterium]